MEYSRSLARVVEVEESAIVALISPKNSFSSCSEKGCHLCTPNQSEQRLKIKLDSTDKFSVGDSIFVDILKVNEAISASLVFIMPLIITFTALLINHFIFGLPLESGLNVSIILTLFILSLFSPAILDRLLREKYPIKVEMADCE